MSFYIFIYEVIIAFLVYLFFSAIADQGIAIVIGLLVLIYQLSRSMKNPYE